MVIPFCMPPWICMVGCTKGEMVELKKVVKLEMRFMINAAASAS